MKALTLIDRRCCSLEHADSRIAAEINGLLNEYGRENGLTEGWWIDEMSTDDVLLNLLALVLKEANKEKGNSTAVKYVQLPFVSRSLISKNLVVTAVINTEGNSSRSLGNLA